MRLQSCAPLLSRAARLLHAEHHDGVQHVLGDWCTAAARSIAAGWLCIMQALLQVLLLLATSTSWVDLLSTTPCSARP